MIGLEPEGYSSGRKSGVCSNDLSLSGAAGLEGGPYVKTNGPPYSGPALGPSTLTRWGRHVRQDEWPCTLWAAPGQDIFVKTNGPV